MTMMMFRTIVFAGALSGMVSTALAQGAAPGGAWSCRIYASATVDTVKKALERNPSCLDYSKGVHANYQMHYNWCMRTPANQVQGAAYHIRNLTNRCARQDARRPRPNHASRGPASTATWSGTWVWVRPLQFFGQPSKSNNTRARASIELLSGNRIKLCIARNPCGNHSVRAVGGKFVSDIHSGYLEARTMDQGRSLNGQFWWDKRKRTQISPDATFVLRR